MPCEGFRILGVIGYSGVGLNGTSLLIGFTGVFCIVGFIRLVDFVARRAVAIVIDYPVS